MAQIDTTIGDMPWLMRGPDQNALVRGVQSGATIANVRNQRAALAQRKFEFEREQMMREAQERRAQAMLPLQQTLMDQEQQMNQHRLTGLLEARKNYVANEKDIAELSGKLARSSDPVTSLTLISEAFAKNYKLIEDPRAVSLRDNLTKQIQMLGDLDLQIARAEMYKAQTEASEDKRTIEQLREQRLKDRLEMDKKELETSLSPQELRAFSADAKVITDDWRLKFEDKQQKLNDLKARYGIAVRQPTVATPAPTNSVQSVETIGRFKVIRE